MSIQEESKDAVTRGLARRRPSIFVIVSRDRPDRYDSLALAFSGDRDVRVIFDRRRAERRQRDHAPFIDRRRRHRRSGVGDWAVRTLGWIRVPVTEDLSEAHGAWLERVSRRP
jgi:hypothetical protein